jgi:mannose-1-phosphate guanylyltransferase
MIVSVILSGGEGKRLRSMSSPTRPKQFLRLTGEETLRQQTLRRLGGMAAALAGKAVLFGVTPTGVRPC